MATKEERAIIEFDKLVNLETGESDFGEHILEVAKSIIKEEIKNNKIQEIANKKEGLKRLRSVKNLVKFKKISEGVFGLKRINNYDLTLEERGMYDVFVENCMQNATYRVLLDCHQTKTELAKFFNMRNSKFDSMMKSLKEADLINYIIIGYTYEIYINPKYFRIGHYVSPKIVEMFGLFDDIENDEM